MLKQACFVFSLLFALSALPMALFFLPPRKQEIDGFAKELQEKWHKDTKKRPFHQIREQVQKDLFLAEENGRRQVSLKACSSIVTVKDKEIVEEMKNLRCFMQDKLSETKGEKWQQVRYFHSDKGVYQFETHLFKAETVDMTLYEAPGWTLELEEHPEKTFLSGIAHAVTFSLKEGYPHFHAEKFKALISDDN